jgi:tRNA threonylcarbamoyladenosine biosynthesis protein TsaE
MRHDAESTVWDHPLPTRRATTRLGRQLAKIVHPGDLVILDGPLGAGKTFFVRSLCRGLGLPDREPVTSPTFALVQELRTTPPLVHADVYRLGGAADVEALGLRENRGEGAVVVVEWGLPYLHELGGDALIVTLGLEPRRAELRGTGPRSEVMVVELRTSIETRPER